MKTITVILPEIEDIKFDVFCEEEFDHPNGCFATGSDEEDEQIVKDILEQLQTNVWAWCTIKVKGRYKGLESNEYLGCCSYKSKEDFVENSGYYEDMKESVYDDIINQLFQLQ